MAVNARPMTDDELVAAISAAEDSAIGDAQGVISSDRADAIARYLGKDYAGSLAAPVGRSSVVSRDVADVVQGVLANVLKPFVGGEQMVEFQPHGPEDEEAAKQETDYVNFVAMERNNGFVVLNTAMSDALLLRTGYVKCGWTVRSDVVLERYQGLSDEEMALLSADTDVQVVEHTEYPDSGGVGELLPMQGMPPTVQPPVGGQAAPQAGGMPAPMLHDVRVRRTKPTEYVETTPCPPDEVIVSQRAREPSLQNVDFCQHRTMQMLSELRQAGYDVPDDIQDSESGETLEGYNRDRWGQSAGSMWDDPTQDRARRLVMFKESWIRIDRDGDGIAELRRVCMVGKEILADEETDIVPLVCFTALIMAHQHIGLSLYDLVEDLAKLKTALLRQFIDNKYLSNNGRVAVSTTSGVNIDDLLTSRPGGIIRGEGDPNTWMMPLVTPDVGASALQGLEYLDTVRESRTGYTRLAQGQQSEQLAHQTMGGMMVQLTQDQLRLEMMTRTIAETGVRDLFRVVHAMTLKHSTRAEKVKLRNKWVAVNPREWVRRTDLTISVGMGNAVPGMQMGNLQAIAAMQEKAFPLGLVDPEKAYNLVSKMVAAAGFKDAEMFFKPPQKTPKMGPDGQPVMGEDGQPVREAQMPPPQPDPAVQVAQIRAKSEADKFQAETQADAQKHQALQQADVQKFQAEQAAKMQQIQMDAQAKREAAANALTLQQSNDQRESQLEQQKHALGLDLEMRKHQLDIDAQIRIANIKAAAEVAKARIAAGQSDGAELLQAEESDAGYNLPKLIKGLTEAMTGLAAAHSAPREIVRGPDGRAAGTRIVNGSGAPH